MLQDSSLSTENYLVLGCKPWTRLVFDQELSTLPGKWVYFRSPRELSLNLVREISPRYLFFLHWSWKVADEIVQEYECVCFHMTDVPYGRGGSPLQNLILRGHHHTKLTALRMTSGLDAGPVYIKEPMSLEGSAQDIYVRASRLSAAMIRRIIVGDVHPTPQQGEVVEFKRRKPSDSLIPASTSLKEVYDFIRMLDADGYPHAFLEYAGLRFEFTNAKLNDASLEANVKIVSAVGGGAKGE